MGCGSSKPEIEANVADAAHTSCTALASPPDHNSTSTPTLKYQDNKPMTYTPYPLQTGTRPLGEETIKTYTPRRNSDPAPTNMDSNLLAPPSFNNERRKTSLPPIKIPPPPGFPGSIIRKEIGSPVKRKRHAQRPPPPPGFPGSIIRKQIGSPVKRRSESKRERVDHLFEFPEWVTAYYGSGDG